NMALFSKKNKEETKIEPVKENEVVVPSSFQPIEASVITSFYISEKAGFLNGFNQYVFRVLKNANKSQLSRQVEKMFKVKVQSVKMMNTKKKRRDVGKYPGFKPGFKKAIVVLEKGYTIEQAKI
ncbi:MAG: 50S ribosomal protein L23, partial [Candidatus Paceibacterota bacterium]